MQQIYRRTPMPKCNFNKTAKLTTAIYVLSNIPSKGNQLIEYNMINIFIEKPYTKCDG